MLAVAAAVGAAACGGDGASSKNLPAGASRASAGAPAFVSIRTDFSSKQWRNAVALLGRFPGSGQLLRKAAAESGHVDFNRDVKPALGSEVDVVWLDFRHGGGDVVALTRPKSKSKFEALIAKGNSTGGSKLLTADAGDGWKVAADSQSKLDRFHALASGAKLAKKREFSAGMGRLDPHANIRAWVSGSAVQEEIDRGLQRSGAPPRLSHDVATLKSIAFAATAERDGVRVDGGVTTDPPPGPHEFSPALPRDFPRGALLYVGFSHLDDATRAILRLVGEAKPSFDTQLQSVEGILGISLKNDVYPLLKGEGGVAVYRGRRIPGVLFAQKVSDEARASSLVRRVIAVARLGGVSSRTISVGGVTVDATPVPKSSVTVYDAVARKKVIVTTDRALLAAMITGAGGLAADPVFAAAKRDARLPGKTTTFAYANLRTGLPFAFAFAERQGSHVSPAARANTRPLESAFLFARKDGDRLRVSGFVPIE